LSKKPKNKGFSGDLGYFRYSNGVYEVGGSNPPAPTTLDKKPFDENAKGLSHCGQETYAIHGKVQTDDFNEMLFYARISIP